MFNLPFPSTLLENTEFEIGINACLTPEPSLLC